MKKSIIKEIHGKIAIVGGSCRSSGCCGQVREVELKNDKNLLTSCIAGALFKEEYLRILSEAGFSVEILNEDLDISKRQYGGLPAESLKLKAGKREGF